MTPQAGEGTTLARPDETAQDQGNWWDDLAARLAELPGADAAAEAAARAHQDRLTKPPGALGRLEEIAVWLAAWQGREQPRLERVSTLVFAGNHGVTAQGISPYPASVTGQMVANFEAGGAAICQLCAAYGAELTPIALDLDRPTADFTTAPAMSVDECRSAMAAGASALPGDIDLLLLGEMGIGNTTAAAALAHALLGGEPEDWVGPGTGLDAAGMVNKGLVVARAVAVHGRHCHHPLEALRRLGGRELAAITGAVLEARMRRIPVLLDGYACGAAALVLARARPDALDHCLAAHVSAEPGHRRLLAAIGKAPLIDLGMRLGEGTGAAVALGLARGALAAHNGMATFAEAGVDDRDEPS